MTENFEKTVHISKKGSDNEVTMDLTLHLIYKLKSFQKKSVLTLNLFPFQRLNTTVNYSPVLQEQISPFQELSMIC